MKFGNFIIHIKLTINKGIMSKFHCWNRGLCFQTTKNILEMLGLVLYHFKWKKFKCIIFKYMNKNFWVVLECHSFRNCRKFKLTSPVELVESFVHTIGCYILILALKSLLVSQRLCHHEVKWAPLLHLSTVLLKLIKNLNLKCNHFYQCNATSKFSSLLDEVVSWCQMREVGFL